MTAWHPLDNPVRSSLAGSHARFAERRGDVLRYPAGRTQPGPFLARTVEMGTYLGIRRGGALVAMAGERLHPPGWTEISAVCTDDRWRGLGLASRLVQAVAAGILARGEVPFLHALATNVTAIRLYEELGFRLRRPVVFSVARIPAAWRAVMGDGRAGRAWPG